MIAVLLGPPGIFKVSYCCKSFKNVIILLNVCKLTFLMKSVLAIQWIVSSRSKQYSTHFLLFHLGLLHIKVRVNCSKLVPDMQASQNYASYKKGVGLGACS